MRTRSKVTLSRRSFIKTSTAFGALTILPAHLALGKKSGSGHLPPSEKINLAAIGIGNQGGSNISGLLSTGMVNIVALCDVDLNGKHTRKAQEACPNAKTFTDFRKMFDEMADEFDAVLIATPDHSHFSAAMLAMSQGKSIYVQKPLAHTFGQCERLMDMAKRSGVVTQMGNQGHSGGSYFQFQEWMKAGIIKDITRIDATMNSGRRWHGWGQDCTGYPEDPVPEGMNLDVWYDYAAVNPMSKELHPKNWRSWFEYGSGAFGDWGPHILDSCHEFLELGLPTSVEAVMLKGHNKFVFPQASTIRFDFPGRKEMPPCVVTWHDGVGNHPELPEELGPLAGDGSRGPLKMPSEGKILHGKELTFMAGAKSSPLYIVPKEKHLDLRTSLPKFTTKASGHFENFLLSIKGEEKARSDFRVSGPLCQVFNLGMISQRLGGTFTFDPVKKQITDNAKANALLDPPPRKGWEEFYNL
ncbi:Gfo/Idh/MocA family oxidoreductase [Haloferula sp. A504]|uniref:Gfo/Idh/MocA family oxidoreductase n=1 Tax=Haloferula sp. A504 TaxID=3373601 RepID=UPI0031BDADA9|nr:Gfo/Idh/MocA family oxidoreductase [Verrucomicrobiaceae bacterium E54]